MCFLFFCCSPVCCFSSAPGRLPRPGCRWTGCALIGRSLAGSTGRRRTADATLCCSPSRCRKLEDCHPWKQSTHNQDNSNCCLFELNFDSVKTKNTKQNKTRGTIISLSNLLNIQTWSYSICVWMSLNWHTEKKWVSGVRKWLQLKLHFI